MKFIGIDPGTACGWGVVDGDGNRLASGVWDLSSRRHEGGGMRYVRARRAFAELLKTFKPEAVGYEEVRRHRGVSAAHVYGGIVAVIVSECEEAGVPYAGQPVGTVKKLATGKGNANKAAMIAAAEERWDVQMADDNEADALWVAESVRIATA